MPAWPSIAFGVAVAGIVVATDGSTFPGGYPTTVALAPAAAVVCSSVGPYRTPDPDSVGLPPELGLCPSGPVTVTADGTVLDGWDVRGGIVVEAADVVVRRSRITGDGGAAYGVRTVGRGSVRIEDTTITGDFPEAGIGEDHWTAERVDVTGVTRDGARVGSGATLRNSWLHDFAPVPDRDSHALALVAPDAVVEDNRVDMGTGPGHGSAVLIANGRDDRRRGQVLIRGNVLGGGDFTLRQDHDGRPVEVRISGNRFRRDAATRAAAGRPGRRAHRQHLRRRRPDHRALMSRHARSPPPAGRARPERAH